MDDFAVQVRQIFQYTYKPVAATGDAFLLQEAAGGAYKWTTPAGIMAAMGGAGGVSFGLFPALQLKGVASAFLTTPLGARQGYNFYVDQNGFQRYLQNGVGGQWSFGDSQLSFAIAPTGIKDALIPGWIPLFQMGFEGQMRIAQQLQVGRSPGRPNEVVTLEYLQREGVTSVNGRHGDVSLESADIYKALCLDGCDPLVTRDWVNGAICAALNSWYYTTPLVFSFNGRYGSITLLDSDITAACTAPGAMPLTVTPPPGDYSQRIANTMFVADAVDDLHQIIEDEIDGAISGNYAPLNSPQFTGVPTAPTANPGSATGQLATTAFVMAAVTESTTGVASFNTRTGAIILEAADVSAAGGALLASPAFTGVPTAPTPAPGTNTAEIATCAFVEAALAAFVPSTGVQTFNTRVGNVTLTTADVTAAGAAPNDSAHLTGIPTAPTAAPATNTTQLATTAFVAAALAALGTGVASFNGRVGAVALQANDVSAVGGALIASPIFTGSPQAPTQNPGTTNTTLATTAFVANAVAGITIGVSSFNTRTGAVALNSTDITAAGGALLASPGFSGAPTAPTPAAASNDNTLATTQFVKSTLAGAAVVASFNTRVGAVTLQGSDISAAGGALVASPTFTGVPAAPTAALNNNTTQLATTAFVLNQLAVAGGVNSFNGRAGAVLLNAADVVATGALSQASGYTNKFRNGTFVIAQRALPINVATGTTNNTLDGWIVAATGGTIAVSQQYNVNIGGAAIRLTGAAGVTGALLYQRIESLFAAQLLTRAKATQPVTVQFTVYNGTAASITPVLSTAFATAQDNFGTTTADLAATNLQPIAAGSMGTVAYTFNPSPSCALGYQVQLNFGGALNAAGAYVDVGLADIRATPGVAGGLNAAPPLPELPDASVEMRRASRYYQTYARLQLGQFISASQIGYTPFIFPTMRTQPTGNFAMNSASGGVTNWSMNIGGNDCMWSGITAGGADTYFYGYWTGFLTAEL